MFPITAAFVRAMTIAQHPSLLKSMIFYLKMDEASGNALDAFGSNDFTDNNTVTSAAGIIGTSRQFTVANSEFFNRGDSAAISTGDIDFSFAVWVYFDTKAADMSIVGKFEGGGDQREYILRYLTGTDVFDFSVWGDGTPGTAVNVSATSFGSPSTGQFIFIATGHDSVNNEIFISVNNGTVDTTSTSGGTLDSTSNVTIGSRNMAPSQLWDGRIDELAFWKKRISAREIFDLYNSGAGLPFD